MKTKFLIIGLTILVLAGGFAVRATRQAGQNQAAIDACATQSARLREATARLEQRQRTASQALAQSDRKARPPSGNLGVGPDADAPGKDAGAKPAGRVTAMTIIANDPQKQAEYLRSTRGIKEFYYGNAPKLLGIPADQWGKFLDHLVQRAQRELDLEAAAAMQGFDLNSGTYKKLKAEIAESSAKEERELLGDLADPLREYGRNQVARFMVRDLAGTAVYSGQPVTLDQVERATQVLAANSQRPPAGKSEVFFNTLTWAAARDQLQGVLSPSQIAILGFVIQRYATEWKMNALTTRLTAEFKARMPAP